jgi:cell surface protein SprA
VANSKGSLLLLLRRLVGPVGGTAFLTLLIVLLSGSIYVQANTTSFREVSDSDIALQDTARVIYDDIDRRPARFRDRRMIEMRGRDGRPGEPGTETELTRDELQERLLTPTDSTARIEHFRYRRRDIPYASFSAKKRRHPLFLTNRTNVYTRSLELDSLGTSVTVRETVDGKDVKIPVTMPLDSYIQQRSSTIRREGWERLAYAYAIDEDEARQADLGDFLSDITTIDIPVPPNPLINIFGRPGIRLNISGAVDIRAGFRRQKSDQTTLSRLDNVRNEPDFKQDVQINVSGLVGDKLNIHADWNTQRTFEYENQLKIRYEGYEDEIIQSVEAGNVSLQTPTQFIGSSQALFGIKSNMQFGPLRLTAVASQQKGRSEELTLSGGTQENTFEIRPYDYVRNHFFVDAIYIDRYEQAMQIDPVWDPTLEITDIEVWITRTGVITDDDERPATAHIILPDKPAGGYDDNTYRDLPTGSSGEIEIGQFVILDERTDYTINKHTGRLTLLTQISQDQAIAIAYRRADGSEFGDFVGTVTDESTRLVLKLVKPRNLIPAYRDAWALQLRNIYNIGGRNLQREGFELRIEYDASGEEPTDQLEGQALLEVFGLDQTDEAGAPTPDNRFDWRQGYTIDPARGEVMFPTLRPFDDMLARSGLDDYRYPEVYDTTVSAARTRTDKDRFRIRGTYSSSVSSSYSLGFNVVEGSVAVHLGGSRLQEGTDYTVDYMLGQIVIRNEAALQPGADLRITYEQNELFQIASKTLLGARGELPIGQNTDLNFTIMSMREETLADKVRVGEEPISNMIFGIDGRTRVPVNFITNAMNKLPFFSSLAESNLQLTGEAAYIRPNRNTKRSTVAIDEGKGVAYIDDFEGSRRSIPIGVNYGTWRYASPPVTTSELGTLPADRMIDYKARTYWYNTLPSDEITLVTDLWPEREVQRGEERIQVLHVRYNPAERGEYNYSFDLNNTIYNTPYNSWGGMMRALTGSTKNLVDENLNFIEFWARVEGDARDGKMYINMGQISERIIYEERLRDRRVNGIHQEDGSRGRQPTGVLNEGEDVGIDGITTEEERTVFADWLDFYSGEPFHSTLVDDPSGDLYRPPRSGDYSGVVGVEGNASTEVGYLPDTEDLNRNGVVDLNNDYYEYEISLDTTNAFQDNPYIVGGGNNGWYQFRIPIRSFDREQGNPSFDNVEFFRIYFTGFDEEIYLRLAEFSFTGNQWEEESRDDETMVISVLNIHENPNIYSSPPGVSRPRERLPDGTEIQGNEQSLVLTINDMQPGDSRQAFRYFGTRSLDVFNYRSLRMFIHGDRTWNVNGEATDYDAEFFVRFGSDTANYYEYRQPVWPMWDEAEGRNFIHIDFAELTATKAVRDTSTNTSDFIPAVNGPPGSTYRVVRNPSLTNIRFLSVGIRNPGDNNGGGVPLRGQVWINEMRLIDVDDTPGWAYRVSSSINLADFGTIRMNMSQTDPSFHRLDQQFGSRQTSRNWELGANFSLQRFLPQSWQRGTELPINYTHSESIVSPQYIPGTDIRISSAMDQQRRQLEDAGVDPAEAQRIVDEVRVESQTVRVTDTYTAPTIRFQIPTERWYLRETVNNLRFGFNYNKTRDRSPTIQHRETWSWQSRVNYALNFSRNNFVQPFSNLFDGVPLLGHYKDIRIFYSPTSFSSGFNLQRSRTDELLRRQAEGRVNRNFTANRNMAFNWRFTENAFINPAFDYRLNVASSLVHLELDEFGRQRPPSQIFGDMFGGSTVVDFGIDNNYTQDVRLDTRPRLPALWGINRFFEFTTGYGSSYRWTRNLAQETLGRSSGVNARFDASVTVNLRDLGNQIFGTAPEGQPGRGQQPPPGRGRQQPQQPQQPVPADTLQRESDDEESGNPLDALKKALQYLIKMPLLDYERLTVSFNQNRNMQNSGLIGGTGLENFWGLPFGSDPGPEGGPSRRYQLGFASLPAALRAPNGNLVDNFSETNRVTMRTQRQLWQGARIDLNWNYSWSFNRNNSLLTDSLGVPEIINSTRTGDVDRSFMTLPPFLIFGALNGNMDEVAEQFKAAMEDPTDDRSEGDKLSTAFEEGMEAIPFLSKIFGQALPRVNWNFRWDGLERLSIFESWARRVSIDHAYSSNYTQRWRGRQVGEGQQTEMQRISMQFNPLIGMNVTFKEFMKGNLSANARYNTSTNYDLNYSSRIIVQSISQEVSFTASYGRRGFAIPMFGLSLSNDIDVSMTFSLARSERARITTETLLTDDDPLITDGATRTSFEPRIRYVLSQRVTATIFYRHSKVSPNKEGSRTPGMTTNEAGLDINISIR